MSGLAAALSAVGGLTGLLVGAVKAGPWALGVVLATLLACTILGAVWMLFTGRIVTRHAHKEAIDQERQRGDDWKETARLEKARNDLLTAQLGEVLAGLRDRPREAA